MAKLQSTKKLQNGRRASPTDESDKKNAIIETVAKWIEVLEKDFNANIEYNIDEITFK